ncbi:MAG: hypothetical protein ACFFD4_10005 [Candidatus Odinarchaeota archaeon]
MPGVMEDQWIAALTGTFWYALIVMLICILLIYSLEMGKMAFSSRLSWEKKSWVVSQPASRFFANYLDFFNQIIYHPPSSIAWKLHQQFLKTLITSKEIEISPKEEDYSFIKSTELREFLKNTKKWTDDNIGSFTESIADPNAYLKTIGMIALPFNRIINEMRLELGLEPVSWKPIPFKQRSYYIRRAIEISFKVVLSSLASLSLGILINLSFFRHPRTFVADIQLAVLLFMSITFVVVYIWVADKAYLKIIDYKRKATIKLTRLAQRVYMRKQDEHTGSI